MTENMRGSGAHAVNKLQATLGTYRQVAVKAALLLGLGSRSSEAYTAPLATGLRASDSRVRPFYWELRFCFWMQLDLSEGLESGRCRLLCLALLGYSPTWPRRLSKATLP